MKKKAFVAISSALLVLFLSATPYLATELKQAKGLATVSESQDAVRNQTRDMLKDCDKDCTLAQDKDRTQEKDKDQDRDRDRLMDGSCTNEAAPLTDCEQLQNQIRTQTREQQGDVQLIQNRNQKGKFN